MRCNKVTIVSPCRLVFVYRVSNITEHTMRDWDNINAKFIYISRNFSYQPFDNNMRWYEIRYQYSVQSEIDLIFFCAILNPMDMM